MRPLWLAFALTGCFGTLQSTKTEASLSKCAGEARAEYYVGHVSPEEAVRVYEACKRREGIQ